MHIFEPSLHIQKPFSKDHHDWCHEMLQMQQCCTRVLLCNLKYSTYLFCTFKMFANIFSIIVVRWHRFRKSSPWQISYSLTFCSCNPFPTKPNTGCYENTFINFKMCKWDVTREETQQKKLNQDKAKIRNISPRDLKREMGHDPTLPEPTFDVQ